MLVDYKLACRDMKKASLSSFQQIYFGRVKALPCCFALVRFCDSLSHNIRVLKCEFECGLGLPLPLVFVLGTREQPRVVQRRSWLSERETTGPHSAYCSLKEKKTAACQLQPISAFFPPLSLVLLFSLLYPHPATISSFPSAVAKVCNSCQTDSASRPSDHVGPHSRMPFLGSCSDQSSFFSH